MLNELYHLAQSMKASGIDIPVQDKRFTTYSRNKVAFLVFLQAGGKIARVKQEPDREQVAGLLKYEASTGGARESTPGFNIPALFRSKKGVEDAFEDKLKQLEKTKIGSEQERLLQEVIDLSENNWDKKEHSLNKCLQSASSELLLTLNADGSGADEDVKPMAELLRRIISLDAEKLHREMVQAVRGQLMNPGPYDNVQQLSRLMFRDEAVAVFELDDPSSFDNYPAHHPKVQAAVKRRLLQKAFPPDVGETSIGVFGEPVSIDVGKMPDPKLPKIGPVKLRSLSKHARCQGRYGMIESASCPVGTREQLEMDGALRWLASDSRQGRTWQDVSGSCGFTKRKGKKASVPGLLLTYPSVLPEDPPELAGIFGGEDQGSDSEGAKFEACAARVTSALDLIVQEHPETEVRVFVLAKADKARTKVLASKHYDARRLIAGARAWREACRNLPRVVLNVGTKDKPRWIEPSVPFPAELVKCLNVAWLQGAMRADRVHGLAIGEGMALLMETGPAAQRIVARALRLATSNATPLLLAIGHADHRGDGSLKLPSRYGKHAGVLPSILGLLLAKLDCMKGDYMHRAPFLVGRLLSLADTLHKEYCRHVRKKETPPQLIGNALMSGAMDNPVSGLARLSERLAIYQAWANKAQGEGVDRAKWTLGQMGQVTKKLAGLQLPDRCDDAAKAQMLLGYLAHIEDEKLEESKSNPNKGNEEVSHVG